VREPNERDAEAVGNALDNIISLEVEHSDETALTARTGMTVKMPEVAVQRPAEPLPQNTVDTIMYAKMPIHEMSDDSTTIRIVVADRRGMAGAPIWLLRTDRFLLREDVRLRCCW
jgi:hypothetical protein